MGYDLINFVEKLHKVHKNPEHALDIVKGLANVFNFHGLTKSLPRVAVMLRRGCEAGLGRVLVFHGTKFTAKCEEMVLLTYDFDRTTARSYLLRWQN